MSENQRTPRSAQPADPVPGIPIIVVSGSMGSTGELLARTVLAQFKVQAPIVVMGRVTSPQQVDAAVERAVEMGGCIVHTLVNKALREHLARRADAYCVFAFDLTGPLMNFLRVELGQEPLGMPGLYRQQQIAYYRRVEAIEFTIAHDDGQRSEDLPQADIVLVGPSRCGKTPLSMYLAMLGWKVANVPMAPGVQPPAALARVDNRRIVALQIAPAQLLAHRKFRQQRLGTDEGSYTDRAGVVEELREYNHFVQRQGYAVLDITDKPVETSSDEVVQLVVSRAPPASPGSAPSP
jgi:regulator of PEP synthase PpsR (kinase-PPPase family)